MSKYMDNYLGMDDKLKEIRAVFKSTLDDEFGNEAFKELLLKVYDAGFKAGVDVRSEHRERSRG